MCRIFNLANLKNLEKIEVQRQKFNTFAQIQTHYYHEKNNFYRIIINFCKL